MKIGIVTSIKAPYRTLQIEEICKNKNIDICVYYTKKGKEDRDWEVRNSILFKEEYLDNINLFERFGTLNKGLRKLSMIILPHPIFIMTTFPYIITS